MSIAKKVLEVREMGRQQSEKWGFHKTDFYNSAECALYFRWTSPFYWEHRADAIKVWRYGYRYEYREEGAGG